MNYELFLFDLDDTLLDFKKSESLSFFKTMQTLGLQNGIAEVFESYQRENRTLWKLFEQSKTSKEHLKVERFRKTFETHKIDIDPELASKCYLEMLPETVVLIDHAVETCEWLQQHGEIGIITNGIHAVQMQRIKNSKLAAYISFVSVSEECGFAKPDARFFEYSVKMAKKFSKQSSIIIGDRLETDILGAHNFGMDCCWFNPEGEARGAGPSPNYEIKHLSELQKILKV